MPRAPAWRSTRAIAEPTSSSSEVHSRLGSSVPDSSRVMSSRFPTSRFRRSASSSTVDVSSRATAVPGGGCSSSALAAPVIAASGVRRSCDTELSSVLRSRSPSAATRARSASAASCARSSGAAIRRTSALTTSRCSGASGRAAAGSSSASTPSRERLPSIGS